MRNGLKIFLIAVVVLALGAFYWIDMQAKAKKKKEETRRAGIAQNRALIAGQAAALHDGPGQLLTSAGETAKPTPNRWTKASSAFLATEARFLQAPETRPSAPKEVTDPAAPVSTKDQTIKTDNEKPVDPAMLDQGRPVPEK